MGLIHSVLLLFLLMGIGFAVSKLGLLNPNFRSAASSYVINLALPMFILRNMNFSFSTEMLLNAIKMLIISLICYVTLSALSLVFARKTRLPSEKSAPYQFGMVFGNVGFMGLPIVAAVFGEEAVFYGAIFNIFFEIFLWTFGVSIFRKGEKLQAKKFITPALISIIIGMSMFLADLDWPELVLSAIESIGSTATPVSMVVLGVMFSEMNIKDSVRDVKPFLSALYRLAVIPSMAGFALYTIGMRGLLLGVPMVILGMPVAANGAMMADYYKKDYREMTKIIVVTTLLSLLTVPIVVSIAQKLM